MSQQDQVTKLKRELRAYKEKCEDLAIRLEDRKNEITRLEEERTKYRSELSYAREVVSRTNEIINKQVDQILLVEKAKMKDMQSRIDEQAQEIHVREAELQTLKQDIRDKDADLAAYDQKLKEMIKGFELQDALTEIKNYREDKITAGKRIMELTDDMNKMESKMERLQAENMYLRELAMVSDNYGDVEQIRYASLEKAEDYKVLVRELENEREANEKEIARLKAIVLEKTMLYDRNGPERYRGLNAEQLNLVDQYVINLKKGLNTYPLNDRSRELKQEVNSLKAKLEFLEGQHLSNLETLLNKMQYGGGRRPQGEETIHPTEGGQMQDIYQRIVELVESLKGKGFSGAETGQAQATHAIQWPPTPISGPFGNWSDVKEGYSYRFKSKIPVELGDFYGENGFDHLAAKYEIAALQLHNLETIELFERKEREVQSLNTEIEEVRGEMKKMLHIQDELFKQYVTEKKTYDTKIQDIETENLDLKQKNEEIEHKLHLLEELAATLKKNDSNELKAQIHDYAKKISIQEVNLIRLARKYDALKTDEQKLREAYHKVEVSFADREADLHSKLSELTAWKTKATNQLKILFNLQVNSVPTDDFRLVRNQLEIYQEKYADLRVKEGEHLTKIAQLETNERDLYMKNELIRDLKEEMMEEELEMEMLKKRLEDLDPVFRKFQNLFRQIIEVIKNRNISPLQTFQLMDRDKSGKLDRREFESALVNMQIPFSKSEMDILFMFLDLDGSGQIEYREFLKRLKRAGIKVRSDEEDLTFKIYEAITKAELTLKQAFDIFDKNSDNLISKEDMVDTFNGMSFGVDQKVIEQFFAMADINGDGTINFDEFYRLFEKTIKDAYLEEKKLQHDKLNWKMEIMLRMDQAIKESGLTLIDAYNIIDESKNGRIDFEEFKQLFDKMGIQLDYTECQNLFNDLDKDKGGTITFPEFQHYFNEAKRENDRLNRLKFLASKTENLRESTLEQIDVHKEIDSKHYNMSEGQRMSMKIALLETREKNAINRLNTLAKRLQHYEQELKNEDLKIRDLQNENLKIKEEYYLALEREFKLEQKLEGSVPKDRAQKLVKLNEKLAYERNDLKKNMILFKSLYESSVGQVKIIKLSLDKRKNEVEIMSTTIKDLQAQSDEGAMIGKLQHELMLSKWNEGVANKKFESSLDQTRSLKIDLQNVETALGEKEDEIVETHNAYREKVAMLEKNLADARVKIIPTISVSKIEELTNKIREIQFQKSDLEQYNRNLRQEIHDLGIKNDYLETQKNMIEDLEYRLKKNNTDELSQQLIEISTKLSEYKLGELQAKRDVTLLHQKEEYHQRLIKQYTDNLKDLERDLADWELKYAKREDFWRKRYNDQMKLIFNKTGGDAAEKTDVKKGADYLNKQRQTKEDTKRAETQAAEYEQILKDKDAKINVLETALAAVQRGKYDASPSKYGDTRSALHEVMGDEEAKKFAYAAQKTIQTLQDIIDDKNNQLERKDELIKRMREEYLAHKTQDAEEIKKLSEAVHQGQRTLTSGLGKSDIHSRSMVDPNVVGKMNAGEWESIMGEKDRKLEMLVKELNFEKDQKDDLKNRIKDYIIQVEDLKSELAFEKDKLDSNALQKEVNTLKKTVKQKNNELQGLRKAIDAVKEEYMKINGMSIEKEEEMKRKLKENNDEKETKYKMAIDRVKELNKNIADQREQIKQLNLQEAENRAKNTDLQKEVDNLKAEVSKKTDQIKEEKELRGKRQLECDDLKEQVQKLKSRASDESASDVRRIKERVETLERENRVIKKDRMPKYFNEDGEFICTDSFRFSSAEQLYKQINQYLRDKPDVNLFAEFKRFDPDGTESIPEAKVYEALQAAGIKLKENDKALLMEEARKASNNEVVYAQLYNKIKGLRDFQVGKEDTGTPKSGKSLNVMQPKEPKPIPEKERALSKNIDILKIEIANLKKENEKLQKQLNNWKDNYGKLDKEHKTMLSKPFAKADEDNEGTRKFTTISKLETVQDLRDRIFELENRVNAYEKVIETEKEPIIKRLKQEKDKLENEVKNLKAENLRVSTQLENYYSKKLTAQQLKEDMIYDKDMIIANLKDKLNSIRERENALETKIFEYEQKNLELTLDKEGHDIQMQRLTRRINDLDEFKSTYQDLQKKTRDNMTTTQNLKKTRF